MHDKIIHNPKVSFGL